MKHIRVIIFSPGQKKEGLFRRLTSLALRNIIPIGVVLLCAAASASAEIFGNPAAITINDNAPATPYPSSVTVSGLSGTVPATAGSIKVTIYRYSHTYSADTKIALVGPTGAAIMLQKSVSFEAVSNITYTLSDTGATYLPYSDAFTAGTYKPTNYSSSSLSFPSPGPATVADPGPNSSGSAATLSSVFGGTNPNGVWKLYVVDSFDRDSGTISGGWSLEIYGSGNGNVQKPPLDYNGDGKTDFTVTRNTGGGTNGQVTWFINSGADLVNYSAVPFGLASDYRVSGDFDGDGRADITVWRPMVNGDSSRSYFYILQSNGGTFRAEQFGSAGDDSSVVGDYDGDGKTDLAVYRAGASAGQQSYWFYRPSGTPGVNFNSIPWGANGDFPAPGDYDGDGKYDFMVQRSAGAGRAVLILSKSGGGATEYTSFGSTSDVICPGDYDGDGKTDIMVTRSTNGNINWYLLTRTGGGTGASPYVFGSSSTDYRAQGDYDGDGKTDIAVWRPGSGTFYVLRSSGGFQAFQWGQSGDYPVANYNSH